MKKTMITAPAEKKVRTYESNMTLVASCNDFELRRNGDFWAYGPADDFYCITGPSVDYCGTKSEVMASIRLGLDIDASLLADEAMPEWNKHNICENMKMERYFLSVLEEVA